MTRVPCFPSICEVQPEGRGTHCDRQAAYLLQEPYTPGRFTFYACRECAEGFTRWGYRIVTQAEAAEEPVL